VSKEGIKVNHQKIKAIIEWPKPVNAAKVRSFLLVLQKVVKDFSKIASPFTNLLKKVTKFDWTYKCKEAFQELNK